MNDSHLKNYPNARPILANLLPTP